MSRTTLANVFPPGEFIREELEARGWTQADLAAILARPLAAVSEIICGKRGITPDTAKALAEALGTSAEFWMNLDAQYQLSKVPGPEGVVRRRARLFEKAPVKDLERRGWIPVTSSTEDLETALCQFYRVQSVEEEPTLAAAARQAVSSEFLTAEQIAWCFRALHLAENVSADPYTDTSLRQAIPTLRRLARHPETAREVPRVLAAAGVKLVLLEHLPRSRMDGAALPTDHGWVIALALRYDRIDYFWHTLMHEVSHVLHGDVGVDPDLSSNEMKWSVNPEIERRANADAAAMLIAPEKLASFIVRKRPFYSKDQINQFANLNQVHPGIVVGQLQHRNEIRYKHNREMLVPIQKHILGIAITDGWGHTPRGIGQ